jgi:hypothetical protein
VTNLPLKVYTPGANSPSIQRVDRVTCIARALVTSVRIGERVTIGRVGHAATVSRPTSIFV